MHLPGRNGRLPYSRNGFISTPSFRHLMYCFLDIISPQRDFLLHFLTRPSENMFRNTKEKKEISSAVNGELFMLGLGLWLVMKLQNRVLYLHQ